MPHARSRSTSSDSSASKAALHDYVDAAMHRARVMQMEDGRSFATVPELRGVWADGDDPAACLRALRDVLVDWALLKLERGDHDFPEIEGIQLTAA